MHWAFMVATPYRIPLFAGTPINNSVLSSCNVAIQEAVTIRIRRAISREVYTNKAATIYKISPKAISYI